MEGGSNAVLMRRIVQLENERDDLRRDVETLCMQQSGQNLGGNDFTSRLQTRRLAGLEQELESCRQKMSLSKCENENLQEELSEVYRIKSQVSELYKVETEKNKKLEEDLKYFQTEVASSLAQRDKLLLELEKLEDQEQILKIELEDSYKKNKQLMEINEENMEHLRTDLNRLKEEREVYHQVVKKFWQLRCIDDEFNTLDAARCLLNDSQNMWSFGDIAERHKLEAANIKLEKELVASKAETSRLLIKVTNENKAKEETLCHNADLEKQVVELEKELAALKAETSRLLIEVGTEKKAKEEAICNNADLKERMLNLGKLFGNTIKEFRGYHDHLKGSVQDVLQTEMSFFGNTMSFFEDFAQKLKTEKSTQATEERAAQNNRAHMEVSQDAFLQALHEKVAALMLLSQEEERHHLEGKTTGALESQIKDLNQKLSQATVEKVEALMQAAQLKYEVQQLKDHERDLLKLLQNPASAGKLLPASWGGTCSEHDVEENSTQVVSFKQSKTKKYSSTADYLKSWWLIGRNRDEVVHNNNEATSTDIARTKVESVALQERMTSLQQLIKSANRLRATLSSVVDDTSVINGLKAVDGAHAEAQRLKLALSCRLPVSLLSQGEDLTTQQGNSIDKSAVELVTVAGMALVELLLVTAELQRASLLKISSKENV